MKLDGLDNNLKRSVINMSDPEEEMKVENRLSPSQ